MAHQAAAGLPAVSFFRKGSVAINFGQAGFSDWRAQLAQLPRFEGIN